MQFQFRASGLAVYLILKCKQYSLEHPTGKCGVRSGDLGGYSMVLGRMILVDTPWC
jgi:hypothetical protein